jgi:hypothetical protein
MRSSAIPASRPRARRPGHRAFFLATRIEGAQEHPLPASGGAGAAPSPKTTAPANWRLALPWVSPGWGGLVGVGGRGHRKGQLRVLGSPSAPHTKEPRTGGPPGGRGVRGPDLFLRKSLVPWYIPGGTKTKTGLPACGPPSGLRGQSVKF